MRTFWEWLVAVAPNLGLTFTEGDEGLQAFIVAQNQSFKDFLRKLLAAKKITDPRLVREAEALIADHSNSLFNYGQELVQIASAGRGRLAGGDTLQAATEAAGRIWEKLWQLESFPKGQTWESRFPLSVQRSGIVGTVRAFANHLIGHFAQRLRKSRASVSTMQQSQIDAPIDPAARAANQEGEWEEWRSAILRELINDLRSVEARSPGGKHGEARIRNLRWAIALAEEQMAIPYQWRSMPKVMEEIPELRGVGRGGLQQTLKALIDDARHRVVAKMGSDREQGVAYWLQRRGGSGVEADTGGGKVLAPCRHFPTDSSEGDTGDDLIGYFPARMLDTFCACGCPSRTAPCHGQPLAKLSWRATCSCTNCKRAEGQAAIPFGLLVSQALADYRLPSLLLCSPRRRHRICHNSLPTHICLRTGVPP
jgi:hypothetical protein